MAAAGEPTPPADSVVPTVPSELIGTIILALIGGIVTIVVAIIQRSKGSTQTATGAPARAPFVVPEGEWVDTRNRAIAVESDHKNLSKDFDTFEEATRSDIAKLQQDIAYVKGQLGIN